VVAKCSCSRSNFFALLLAACGHGAPISIRGVLYVWVTPGADAQGYQRFVLHPQYLGMDRNRFNRDVRPHVTVIPIGMQGIAFDRLALDARADEYKHCNRRPAVPAAGIEPATPLITNQVLYQLS
jgi:hypothetical protein